MTVYNTVYDKPHKSFDADPIRAIETADDLLGHPNNTEFGLIVCPGLTPGGLTLYFYEVLNGTIARLDPGPLTPLMIEIRRIAAATIRHSPDKALRHFLTKTDPENDYDGHAMTASDPVLKALSHDMPPAIHALFRRHARKDPQ